MDLINYDDFAKLNIRIGNILEAEQVEGSEKLIKMLIDFGDEKRTIVSGIAKWYTPTDLIGKQVPVLVNLEPRKLKGVESQGMMLCADMDGDAVILNPDKEISAGSPVL